MKHAGRDEWALARGAVGDRAVDGERVLADVEEVVAVAIDDEVVGAGCERAELDALGEVSAREVVPPHVGLYSATAPSKSVSATIDRLVSAGTARL